MKKKNISTIILILIFIVGLSLLLYPTLSDYWNSFHQSRVVSGYVEEVAQLDNYAYDQIWADAEEYNRILADRQNQFVLSVEQRQNYESLLDIGDTGVMGYVDIPSLDTSLPIYHGTDDAVLQVAIGHLDWTSLPVGGESTHCVISGHRGLPSAKLFTNLDQLVEGDLFMLKILDETLTYEVDRILIVEPEDTDALMIENGKDYCTLVTCTPYGINSHRLLVRGHRVDNTEEASTIRVTADATQIEPLVVAPIAAIPLLLILLIWLLAGGRRNRRGKNMENIQDILDEVRREEGGSKNE